MYYTHFSFPLVDINMMKVRPIVPVVAVSPSSTCYPVILDDQLDRKEVIDKVKVEVDYKTESK